MRYLLIISQITISFLDDSTPDARLRTKTENPVLFRWARRRVGSFCNDLLLSLFGCASIIQNIAHVNDASMGSDSKLTIGEEPKF